jgi:hypothetical protein
LIVLAAHGVERRFHLRLHRVAERRNVFEAKALGELVVQFACVRTIGMQDGDIERRPSCRPVRRSAHSPWGT